MTVLRRCLRLSQAALYALPQQAQTSSAAVTAASTSCCSWSDNGFQNHSPAWLPTSQYTSCSHATMAQQPTTQTPFVSPWLHQLSVTTFVALGVGGAAWLLAQRNLNREPEPFEAEYNEDEFEDGEFEDMDLQQDDGWAKLDLSNLDDGQEWELGEAEEEESPDQLVIDSRL